MILELQVVFEGMYVHESSGPQTIGKVSVITTGAQIDTYLVLDGLDYLSGVGLYHRE